MKKIDICWLSCCAPKYCKFFSDLIFVTNITYIFNGKKIAMWRIFSCHVWHCGEIKNFSTIGKKLSFSTWQTWRNLKFITTGMWKNVATYGKFVLLFVKSVLSWFTHFVAKSVLSQFTYFWVEKFCAKILLCGEKMTNMRSSSSLW